MAAFRWFKRILRVGVMMVVGFCMLFARAGVQGSSHDPANTHGRDQGSLIREASTTTYTVTKTADDGSQNTLRWAIDQANTTPGSDTIHFDIPPTDPKYDDSRGVWLINLTAGGLTITDDETYIYGSSQSYFQGNTNPDGPEIEVAIGSGSATVFTFTSANNFMNQISIVGGTIGVLLTSPGFHNDIEYCTLGIDATGTTVAANSVGISVANSHNDLIRGNIIAGNSLNGVQVIDSQDTQLLNNYIGISPYAVSDVGNVQMGIILDGATGTIVGGDVLYRNFISGNHWHGVHVFDSSGTEISHNYIGTNIAGTGGWGNWGSGIYLSGNSDDAIITGNLSSGNGNHGIYLNGSNVDNALISENLVGSNSAGNAVIGNAGHGIIIENGATGDDVLHNTILGNGWSGLVFLNSAYNYSHGNFIGLSPTSPSTSLGNLYYGIHILGSFNGIFQNTIAYNGLSHPANGDGVRVDGTSYPATSNSIVRNSIYANGGKGIENISTGNENLDGPLLDPGTSCTHVSGVVPEPIGVIDIYTGPDDEGKTWLIDVYPDPISGKFELNVPFRGSFVSATWTKYDNLTSEFSAAFACNLYYVPLLVK